MSKLYLPLTQNKRKESAVLIGLMTETKNVITVEDMDILLKTALTHHDQDHSQDLDLLENLLEAGSEDTTDETTKVIAEETIEMTAGIAMMVLSVITVISMGISLEIASRVAMVLGRGALAVL